MQRVLIANRGEIAVRVIRACEELGLDTVAIYSTGEEDALHVRRASQAYRLPDESKLPYLNRDAIIALAVKASADAIHPGYGFLAENAEFAEDCIAAGLTFVGPGPDAIRLMGDKVQARRLAILTGVPVVEGSDGPIESVDAAERWATLHGYPVAIKAAAGGGGRGFRVAHQLSELRDAFEGSAAEAQRYFSDSTVFMERYLLNPRHVEVQLFADNFGNIVWLGERDCSVQRRHQKLIEETPSPAVDEALRLSLGEAAVSLARAVDYRNAGTCEFLVADDGTLAFLEMNTRIQVEHTITEEVTGIDLVKEQLRVAAGEPLSFTQESVTRRGHSVQCRINAEDAGREFRPSPGVVTTYRPPDGFGVRVDSAVEDGVEIPPLYDSMIAKLITWGRNREESLDRMSRALGEFVITGVPTLIPFHQQVINHPVFRAGNATTTFLNDYPESIPANQGLPTLYEVPVAETSRLVVEVDGRRLVVDLHGALPGAEASRSVLRTAPVAMVTGGQRNHNSHELVSPIQGLVLSVAADLGATVDLGDLICVVEAMKMENEVMAHRSGVVTSLPIAVGDQVRVGMPIAVIE